MKSNLFKAISYFFFGMLLLNAGQVFGQADVVRPGSEQKGIKGESAKPATSNLKGEYTKDADCVDLYVRKGCVNYTVSVPGEKVSDKIGVVKVCVDPKAINKPTNICRKGAKRISVKWEKLDPTADVEFKPNDNKANKKQ